MYKQAAGAGEFRKNPTNLDPFSKMSNYITVSGIMRKPVFRVSNKVRHKPSLTTTEDGKRLEIISDKGRRGIVLSMALN